MRGSARKLWLPVSVAIAALLVPNLAIAQDASELVANIAGVGDVAASGTATFFAEGSGTRIEVSITGLPPGMHANHVHHGSCEGQGEVHVPLTELDVSAGGDAQASTVWPDNDLTHFSTSHYVAAHELSSADGVGPVIACGNVVAAAQMAPPASGNAGLIEGRPGPTSMAFAVTALVLAVGLLGTARFITRPARRA